MTENSAAASEGFKESTSAQRKRRSRGRGLRVTTGCAVCRARHLKCDEVKPVCGPCARGPRACSYEVKKKDPPPLKTIDSESSSNLPLRGPPPAVPLKTESSHESIYVGIDPSLRNQTQQRAPATPYSTSGRSRSSSYTQPNIPDHQGSSVRSVSPRSSVSINTACSPDSASRRWLGLLASDIAALRNGSPFGQYLQSPPLDTELPEDWAQDEFGNIGRCPKFPPIDPAMSPPLPGLERVASLPDGHESYQYPVQLQDDEIHLLRHYIANVSPWVDLYDPDRPFATLVPHLALKNEGLMRAILCTAARHLSIYPGCESTTLLGKPVRTLAIQFYAETLRFIQSAMKYKSYTRSQEFAATVLLVSLFEILDGSPVAWERHLKGIFWIQRSQENNGECGGLKQTVWWTWLAQDTWSAFRESRRCFSFWKPTKPAQMLGPHELATRSIYLLSQVVNFHSPEERAQRGAEPQVGMVRARQLVEALEAWRGCLGVSFEPLPVAAESVWEEKGFKPLWINPKIFGGALQLHAFATILLITNLPPSFPFPSFPFPSLSPSFSIDAAIDTLGGIGLMATDDVSRNLTTTCLWSTLLVVKVHRKRQAMVEIIKENQRVTGWPAFPVEAGLRSGGKLWAT
ncbi:hypothetical protein K402DRAFT_122573 [Aulographum hederae CBS 113979]|uniref:Zn(2)-C6 fungal-type domain-containing protein n=1 Tax=Aulographum hederae CBS 113979 TaxID=1176131 RepID=A0A6G1GVL2_9PEZI|nr:hypothetical protein K402DRAFT_122573 [Aulographum hederae CBS 113979]